MADDTTYDVLVIGGGASGLMAALVAAQAGKSVLVLEKKETLGKKLSITGGGRCNILNAETDVRVLLSHYGDAAKFLHSPFATFGMQAVWDFFVRSGLPLKVEAGKRAFPVSEKAHDVVAFFTERLKACGVTIRTGVTVERLVATSDAITGVQTSGGVVTARSYVLATGGLSHPETGSTGAGLAWLSALGHTVVRPNPSLVPLIVQDAWVRSLAGVTLADAHVTFAPAGSGGVKMAKPFSRRGKLLFTHFGVSGPVILNAAGAVQELLAQGPVTLSLNVLPVPVDAADRWFLAVSDAHKNKTLKNVLKYLVPPGMSTAVASLLPLRIAETPVHSLTREDRQHVLHTLQHLEATVVGTKGNDWAIVSDGGLDLREVDTKTMRSKRYHNLYVTGDVLHISRPSGGYSLQLCWTTGYVAGMHA